MLISAIIICQNARPFIQTCIESVRQQSQQADEIIVVDGNSQDGTKEWLLQQVDLRVLTQTGTGIANARNQGIRAAAGKYIAFLDADDSWMPQKLAQQLLYISSGNDNQAITCHLIKTDDASAKPWVAMTPGGFLFKQQVFNLFGFFDERWAVASDHEWFIRAVRQGLRYAVMPEVLLCKGMHSDNLSIVKKSHYRLEMMEIMRSRS
ncbi:glycosyltransferase family 2 protein [Spirosoma sp. KNUC1025]|uniref:glycosyltransferase family 2 protein n=1 Tax=Spirosoma sp. KNUC1025 TaxID=2894082 RepID=UPI00386684E5|nr:glycosyltransferase [Spirosoma sp. KNUC1025]